MMANPFNFNHLILFTRFPQPETTKTRLIPLLGPQGAADLQREMTEHVAGQVRAFLATHPVTITIQFDGGTAGQMKKWLGNGFDYRPQDPGHIGCRMRTAFKEAFTTGAKAAVLVGSDIPGISPLILQKAFTALSDDNMVIGPARDGGYYLIGLGAETFSRIGHDLFDRCDWGGDTVFAETVASAGRNGVDSMRLEELADIDRPEDLPVWYHTQVQKKKRDVKKGISIIIPVLNEEKTLKKTLLNAGRGKHREIIVVDGGSSDATTALATSMGAKVINSAPPRSRQMNKGAAAASGDILLFLHGDTCLPQRYHEYVHGGVETPGFAAGAFSLRIDSPARAMGLIGKLANLRSRFLSLPYGDQGLFLTAENFWTAGGFTDIPIMEDFELVRRLKKMGGNIVTLPASVVTSSRRWAKVGVLKTTLINQMVLAAYFSGIPLPAIAEWYRSGGVLPGRKFLHKP
jgi:hypothetical protein